jgi:transcription antitermination factor NusG
LNPASRNYVIGQQVEPAALRHRPRYALNLADGLSDDHAGLRWYFARAATRQEAKAEESLTTAGVAFYFPRLTRWGDHGRKKIKVRQSLFEGYGFVGLADGQSLYELPDLQGFCGVIRFGREACPPPVPMRLIAPIVTSELAGHYDRTLDADEVEAVGFEKDEIIRVVDGAFAGFNACILRLPSRKRVEILVSIFGRSSRVDLPVTAIRKM